MDNLKGIRVAILVENGFEQVELTEPRKALDQAGAQTRIVSPKSPRVRGWKFTEWATNFRSTCLSTAPARTISTHCICPAASSIPTTSA